MSKPQSTQADEKPTDKPPASPRALPTVALKALEPREGGFWALTGQSSAGEAFCITYFMENGTQAISYTMQPCTTTEQAMKHFRHQIYEPPMPQASPVPMPGENVLFEPTMPFADFNERPALSRQKYSWGPTHTVHTEGLAPHRHFSQNQIPSEPPYFTSQSTQSPAQAHFAAVTNNATRHGHPHVLEASPAEMAPQGLMKNDVAMLDQQDFFSNTAVEGNWGCVDELLTTLDGTLSANDLMASSSEPNHFFDNLEETFAPTGNDESWNQFNMKESWDAMFTSP